MRGYGALLLLILIQSKTLQPEEPQEAPAPCQINVTFTTHNNMQDTKQQATNAQTTQQNNGAPASKNAQNVLKKWFGLVSNAVVLSTQLTRLVIFRI